MKYCRELHGMLQEAFMLDCGERRLSAVLHLPATERPPVVVTCHGLFSSKQSDKFVAIAQAFSEAGLAVIRFDFSGCGQSTGLLADTTVSRRLEELRQVVCFARSHPGLGPGIGLLGSSLGGFVALLAAGELAAAPLSVWATPYRLPEICQNIPPADLQGLRPGFFEDARRQSLSAALPGLARVQIIHGKRDEVVPWQHAQDIFNDVKKPKELRLFPNGDHTLSSANDRRQAVAMSLGWFRQYLC